MSRCARIRTIQPLFYSIPLGLSFRAGDGIIPPIPSNWIFFLTRAPRGATIFAQGIHLESVEGTDQTKGVDHGFSITQTSVFCGRARTIHRWSDDDHSSHQTSPDLYYESQRGAR